MASVMFRPGPSPRPPASNSPTRKARTSNRPAREARTTRTPVRRVTHPAIWPTAIQSVSESASQAAALYRDAAESRAVWSPVCREFMAKPSAGLEPETPRCHGSPEAVTAPTGVRRGTFVLQIAASRRVGRARVYPRVPKLVYPSRTRAVLSVYETSDERSSDSSPTPTTSRDCAVRGCTVTSVVTGGSRRLRHSRE
jgi:hypothetical protein